jgi:sulfite exporter TauE/SafE
MLVFGIGTAGVLLMAAMLSGKVLNRWRPGLLNNAGRGKVVLGSLLLLLGAMVFSGMDKVLEEFALGILPEWALTL